MQRWWSVVAALAMAQACTTAPDPDPARRAAQVMAQAKAAAGGPRIDRAATFYNSGTRVRDGKIDGVFEEWGDYRTMAYTNTETFAGVTSTSGYDGNHGWQLGPDGRAQVITDPQRMIGTKLSGYLDVQGYFFPERFPATFAYAGVREIESKSYDVVTVSPEGQIPIDLWLDAKTHLVRRLTGKMGSLSIQGDVNSYQTIDGLPILRTALQTMTTGPEAHTETQNVAVFRFEPVAPERLAIPK